MTDLIKEYYILVEEDGTKDERRKLLEEMDNEEIKYLVNQAGNQTARIFYSQFRK